MSEFKSRREAREAWQWEYWHRVLPGVPDDQIVLARYHAKNHLLGPCDPTDDAQTWRKIAYYVYHAILLGVPPEKRVELTPTMRRLAKNTSSREFKWWDSLGERTLLKLNQSLYARHNKWKDGEPQEFWICWGLCVAWLN